MTLSPLRRGRAVRAACCVVTVAFVLGAPLVHAEPAPTEERDATIATLHRQGDALFEQDDYAGAREAWSGALRLADEGDAGVAYRVSLVSLIVSATLGEFAVSGDAALLDDALRLVDATREDPALDAALVDTLEHARSRLEPLLDRVPEPQVVPPASAPTLAPAPDGVVALDEGQVVTRGPDLAVPMMIGGSVATVFGAAAIIAGSTFKPRAIRMVEGEGQRAEDALEFVNPEIRKGQGWIATGAVVTALGLGALVTGVVLHRRSRRVGMAADAGRFGGAVAVYGRF